MYIALLICISSVITTFPNHVGGAVVQSSSDKRTEIDSSSKLIRFAKFNYTDVSGASDTEIEFPLTNEEAIYLRESSNSISVIMPSDGCNGEVNFDRVKNVLKAKKLFPPSHPEEDQFWDLFAEVVRTQYLRKRWENKQDYFDPLPEFMPEYSLPKLWKDYGFRDVAEAVHDEFPGIHHINLITTWLQEGSLVPNNQIIPKFGKIDFLRGPVMISDMVGTAIRLVGTCNFALKWECGRARPEEVAWKIYQEELIVPNVHSKTAFEISYIYNGHDDSATRFTAYPEGSPTHPSWPAMHSAASSGSYWLSIMFKLTNEQKCEAKKLDYAIAYGRTIAGVHYPDDNIAGLILGEEILLQLLPEYLSTVYGAAKEKVAQSARNKLFDWTTFKDTDCYKGNGFSLRRASSKS